MKPVISLVLLLSACSLWASQPTLTSVTQPLYFLGSAADHQIEQQSVPKILLNASAEAWVGLFSSPTVVEGSGGDLNLISVYGIDVRILKQADDGRIEEIVIDSSKAEKPKDYPFGVAEVLRATHGALVLEFEEKRPKIFLAGADGKRQIYEPADPAD